MKLLQRRERTDDYVEPRPLPDEALEPQPEHDEPRLAEPRPLDLSKRDYLAILRRAFKQAMKDHVTNIAAALAYYAFLAIPSALLLGLGLFSLIAGPHAVTTIVDKLGTIMPSQATSLLKDSLLVLGPQLSKWIGNAIGAHTLVTIVWWAAQWPLLIGGLLFAFAGILYLGPNVEHPRWRFLTFGSGFAVVIWLAASGLFAVYVSQFGSYNKTWGALSAVVLLLTLLWLSAVALLLGAEINAEAQRSRELRRGEPAEVELQAPTKT